MQAFPLSALAASPPKSADVAAARPLRPSAELAGGFFAVLAQQFLGVEAPVEGALPPPPDATALPAGGRPLPLDPEALPATQAALTPAEAEAAALAASLPAPAAAVPTPLVSAQPRNAAPAAPKPADQPARPAAMPAALPAAEPLKLRAAALPELAVLQDATPSPAASTTNTALNPAATFAQITLPTTASNSAPALPVLDIEQPVGDPEWNRALGERLHWMTDNGVGRAQIRLHPAHLGPIEVSVQVEGDDVSVLFSAQHASTREALETAMPRLREMLGDSGLNLGQASVSQHSPGEQQHATARNAQGGALHTGVDAEADAEGGRQVPERAASHHLLDAYA